MQCRRCGGVAADLRRGLCERCLHEDPRDASVGEVPRDARRAQELLDLCRAGLEVDEELLACARAGADFDGGDLPEGFPSPWRLEADIRAARDRIAVLESVLEDEAGGRGQRVRAGDRVRVRAQGSAVVEEFTVGGPRGGAGWVSARSPLGSALLGGYAGDTVEFVTAEGDARVEVVKVLTGGG